MYNLYTEDYERALIKHLDIKDEYADRKFCNFVYSNENASKERDIFFSLLNNYKKIDSGGRYKNNIGGAVENKYEFQMGYKFSIAFENSLSSGYTTEKILQAFSAKTIPIYWGNPKIGKDFNEKAFINCHAYNSFGEVIERVKEIDVDKELYLKILEEPAFVESGETRKEYENLHTFIKNICGQNPEEARRRGTGTWNRIYYETMRRLYRLDDERFKRDHFCLLRYLCKRRE